jgi:hypothetical protein
MNDVRETIERVAQRFDPADDGFRDLARRRRRARARRRIAAGAFALAVAAAGSLLAVRALVVPAAGSHPKVGVAASAQATTSAAATSAPAATATTAPVAGGRDCPTPSGDSPPQVVLSTTSGPAGSSVEASGTFQTNQLWLQLWWNADDATTPDTLASPPWPPTGPTLRFGPAGPGPVVELAAVEGATAAGDCSFRTPFRVPDVDPGTYHVLWVIGAANPPAGETGYGLFTSPATFEVTP